MSPRSRAVSERPIGKEFTSKMSHVPHTAVLTDAQGSASSSVMAGWRELVCEADYNGEQDFRSTGRWLRGIGALGRVELREDSRMSSETREGRRQGSRRWRCKEGGASCLGQADLGCEQRFKMGQPQSVSLGCF